MKKATEILMTAAMIGCVMTPVYAENESGGTVTITHTVQSSYQFTIPDAFTTSENGIYTVTIAEKPVIPYNSEIRISITKSENGTEESPFRMKNENNQYIFYEILKDNQKCKMNSVVLTQQAGLQSEVKTDLKIVPEKAQYSGTYQDVVTFSVSVVVQ